MPPVDVMKQKLSGFPDFTTFTLLRDADIEELNKVSSRLWGMTRSRVPATRRLEARGLAEKA